MPAGSASAGWAPVAKNETAAQAPTPTRASARDAAADEQALLEAAAARCRSARGRTGRPAPLSRYSGWSGVVDTGVLRSEECGCRRTRCGWCGRCCDARSLPAGSVRPAERNTTRRGTRSSRRRSRRRRRSVNMKTRPREASAPIGQAQQRRPAVELEVTGDLVAVLGRGGDLVRVRRAEPLPGGQHQVGRQRRPDDHHERPRRARHGRARSAVTRPSSTPRTSATTTYHPTPEKSFWRPSSTGVGIQRPVHGLACRRGPQVPPGVAAADAGRGERDQHQGGAQDAPPATTAGGAEAGA